MIVLCRLTEYGVNAEQEGSTELSMLVFDAEHTGNDCNEQYKLYYILLMASLVSNEGVTGMHDMECIWGRHGSHRYTSPSTQRHCRASADRCNCNPNLQQATTILHTYVWESSTVIVMRSAPPHTFYTKDHYYKYRDDDGKWWFACTCSANCFSHRWRSMGALQRHQTAGGRVCCPVDPTFVPPVHHSTVHIDCEAPGAGGRQQNREQGSPAPIQVPRGLSPAVPNHSGQYEAPDTFHAHNSIGDVHEDAQPELGHEPMEMAPDQEVQQEVLDRYSESDGVSKSSSTCLYG